MLKQAILGMGLLAASSVANAAFIVSQSSISGADMSGMEVTATFEDGSSETALWVTTSDTLGTSGAILIDQEGLAGGAFGSSWSLTLAGFTLPNIGDGIAGDLGVVYGDWLLENQGSGIASFSINGMMAGVAFDIIAPDEVTPGSETGAAFDSLLGGIEGSYANQVDPAFGDLFWQLDVALEDVVGQGDIFQFSADTDLLTEVSTPATIGIFLGALVLFARRSRSSVTL
jgi:hypothetical protein